MIHQHIFKILKISSVSGLVNNKILTYPVLQAEDFELW
jgi:hypothetical protein